MTTSDEDPPQSPKAVARIAADAFGGVRKVHAYYDEREENRVPILTCLDSPGPGWMTCSTLSLHLSPNLLDGKDLRVELMATAAATDVGIANAIATAAFNVIKDGWLAAPGVVFPDLIKTYVPDTTTPHVMWAEPMAHERLSTVQIPGVGDVHWLLAMPLNDQEVALLHRDGYSALESKLGASSAEYFDLRRPSVV